MKNQYKGGDCLKRGAGTVYRFKGVLGKKDGGGVFERRVDTPMHTMSFFKTTFTFLKNCWFKMS